MTHLDWISSRQPASPPALVARVRELFAAHPEWERETVTEALVRASELLLATVLADEWAAARDGALDLLAADACITWAFEAASDDSGTLGPRAEEAMRRLASVAL